MICGQTEVIFFFLRRDDFSCGHHRIIMLEQRVCPRFLEDRAPKLRPDNKPNISGICGMGKAGSWRINLEYKMVKKKMGGGGTWEHNDLSEAQESILACSLCPPLGFSAETFSGTLWARDPSYRNCDAILLQLLPIPTISIHFLDCNRSSNYTPPFPPSPAPRECASCFARKHILLLNHSPAVALKSVLF